MPEPGHGTDTAPVPEAGHGTDTAPSTSPAGLLTSTIPLDVPADPRHLVDTLFAVNGRPVVRTGDPADRAKLDERRLKRPGGLLHKLGSVFTSLLHHVSVHSGLTTHIKIEDVLPHVSGGPQLLARAEVSTEERILADRAIAIATTAGRGTAGPVAGIIALPTPFGALSAARVGALVGRDASNVRKMANDMASGEVITPLLDLAMKPNTSRVTAQPTEKVTPHTHTHRHTHTTDTHTHTSVLSARRPRPNIGCTRRALRARGP